jgi:hypothetical protein
VARANLSGRRGRVRDGGRPASRAAGRGPAGNPEPAQPARAARRPTRCAPRRERKTRCRGSEPACRCGSRRSLVAQTLPPSRKTIASSTYFNLKLSNSPCQSRFRSDPATEERAPDRAPCRRAVMVLGSYRLNGVSRRGAGCGGAERRERATRRT